MKVFYILIGISCLFANELEVEGNLTVTGDINSPTIDALAGVTPDRIYTYRAIAPFSFTVPQGKFWKIVPSAGGVGSNAGTYVYVVVGDNPDAIVVLLNSELWLFENKSFSSPQGSEEYIGLYTIYEYSISGSGTDQGMDYIVP
tara:strand:- start:184 stop:615 length:432 start_codon:yes stop_codon:yes gene_type:complete